MRYFQRVVLLSIVVLTLQSCGPSTDSASITPFTVSGTLVNKTGIDLPNDVQVECFWQNDKVFGDQVPTFGIAKLDRVHNTFSIDFAGLPPVMTAESATNRLQLGYGYIVLLSASQATSPSTPFTGGAFYGAVNNQVVLYNTRTRDVKSMSWLNGTPQGYSVAKTTFSTDTTLDIMATTPNTGLELEIDTAFSDFHFSKVVYPQYQIN